MRYLLGRRILGACLALVVLVLSSCTGQEGLGSSDSMASVVSQGILRPADAVVIDSTEMQNFQIITAELGDLGMNVGVPVVLVYTTQRHLYFRNNSGIFSLEVQNGQMVSTDDVLAHLAMENEALEIDRAVAEWNLNRFNTNAANDTRWLDVENARNELDLADDANWRQRALQLAQAELRYERFRFDTQNNRRTLEQALADIDEVLAGEYLRAPFDGMVIGATRSPNNAPMTGRPRILTLVDPDEFFFVINVDNQIRTPHAAHTRLIGYGDILTVRTLATAPCGELPLIQFEARVVSDPWGAGQRDRLSYWLTPVDREAFIGKLYEIDPDNPMFALSNINFSSSLSVTLVDNGILLPTSAVYPQDRRNFVYLYEGGRFSKRYVVTGVRSGGYVHIISGLEPGAQVVVLQ